MSAEANTPQLNSNEEAKKLLLYDLNELYKESQKRLLFVKQALEKIRARIAFKQKEQEEKESRAKQTKEDKNTVSGLLHNLDASSDEIARLEKQHGSSLYDDLVMLEKRLLDQRREDYKIRKAEIRAHVKQVRKDRIEAGWNASFQVNEAERDAIAEKNSDTLKGFILQGKSLKGLKRQKVDTIQPLLKSLVSAAFYNLNAEVTIVENINGRKQKRKQALPILEALEFYYKSTVGRVVKNVTSTVKTVSNTASARIAASRLGKFAMNVNTKVTAVGKVVVKAVDGIKVANHFVSGTANAILPAAAVYVVTGGAIVPAGITLGVFGASKGLANLLADPHLSSIEAIRKFQLKYGHGQFLEYNHTWRTERLTNPELKGQLKTLMSELDANYANYLKKTAFLKTQAVKAQIALGNPDGVVAVEREFAEKMSKTALEVCDPIEAARINTLKSKLGLFEAANDWDNVFHPLDTGLRVFNSASTLGSLGLLIGSVFGVSTAGFVIGAAIGGGGQFVYDVVAGKAIHKIMQGNNVFMRALLKFPVMDLVGQVSSNLWLASQKQMIMGYYKGDVGQYLKENFAFGDESKPAWQNALITGANYFQLGTAITGTASLVSGLITVARILNPALVAGTSFGSLLAVGGAMTAGTIASIAVVAALGLPVGIATITAATIGSAIGVLGAMAVLATVAWPVMLVAAFAGGLVGSFIGSWIDSQINKFVGNFMGMVNGLATLFQMLSLLTKAINSDDIISLAIGMISLIQMWDKEIEMSKENMLLEQSKEKEASQELEVETFSYYNVHLVSNIPMSAGARENFISFLESNSEVLQTRFPNKQIYLTTAQNASYEGENMVLLSFDINNLEAVDSSALSAEITEQLPQLATTSNLLVELN